MAMFLYVILSKIQIILLKTQLVHVPLPCAYKSYRGYMLKHLSFMRMLYEPEVHTRK